MDRKRLAVIGIALVAAGSCLQEVSSQPTPVAPPEIHCKHFLYDHPLGTP